MSITFWIHIRKQKLLIESIIVVGMLLVGTFTLMMFLMNTAFGQVEKNNILLNNSLMVQGNDYEYRTINVSSGDFVASFTVSDGKIIKFYPFSLGTFSMWQEGQFDPSWVESDHADYGMGIISDREISEPMYLVFLNDDFFEKEVHLRFFRVWHERNYLAMIGGIAMMAIGSGIGVGLKINKLQIGYLVCAYIAGFLMIPFFPTLVWSFGHFNFLIIVSSLQGSILLASLPLGVLIYLWLEKGGGSAYLESWNMGKKLRMVGFLLVSGVLLNVALLTIDALTLWNFSSTRVEIEHGVTRVPDPMYFGLFWIVCTMILSGIVLFSGLWLRKSELLA